MFVTAPDGGIINDPVLLRLEESKFWLSLADSDVGLWAQGLAYQLRAWTSPSRRSTSHRCRSRVRSRRDLMAEAVRRQDPGFAYYYMSEDMELNGMRVRASRGPATPASLGYEIYLYDASRRTA